MEFARNILSHIIIFTLLAIAAAAPAARALPPSTYTGNSALSTGNWVKVSVKETGIHYLSANDLRRMGFNDISRVRIHGYGAMRLPDRLDATYIDDLPQVAIHATDRGIYFYATGPVSISQSGKQLIQRQNPHTTLGYYYITDSDTPARTPRSQSTQINATSTDRFTEIVYHEQDMFNPGETGLEMLGEDFISSASRSFSFNLPGRIEGTPLNIECSFYAYSKTDSRVVLSVNDKALTYDNSDLIAAVTDTYTHASSCTSRKTADIDGDRARVTVTHTRSAVPSMARLNYLTLNYTRYLSIDNGRLNFRLTDNSGRLQGSTTDTRLWDITNPGDPIEITLADGSFSPAVQGSRNYAAWNIGASYPTPTVVGKVANQNLHGEPVPDMVIFTHPSWKSEAERVADLHRNDIDSLRVLIVEPENLYNEFSSGSPDANALRKLLKMFWDRSNPADAHHLQYALIMGRSLYDNRRLMSTTQALGYPTLPGWQTDNILSDNTSYPCDDIYGMLADGAGSSLASDYLCISVGRMPVISQSDARNVVDKLISYTTSPINSTWKNRVIMVADDGNQGKFMIHSEDQIQNAMASNGGTRAFFQKVYLDSYERSNSTYPGARSDMFRMLTEGAVWWNFAGHANPSSWTGDGLMTYADINNMYLKHFPFTVAATCDFLRWDSRTISAAEILYRTPSSGIIGAISATRPAYVDSNGDLLRYLGNHMFALDSDGRNLPIGEIYRRTKNNSTADGIWHNSNKLRYVLMGDPAMRLCIPTRNIVLEQINGIAPTLDNQPTMMAGQDVTITGYITDEHQKPIDDFDGTISITLYDAEFSTTSHGYNDTEPVTFEQQGKRLQAKIDSVVQGRFKTTIIVPNDITHNFRPAALNMYAVATDGRDAIGINRDFYVFGFDENATPDTIPPVIDDLYLNHSSFTSGDIVNTTPVVIARVSDNRSINLSSAGIGHQMLLTIDGRSLTDVPLYYTPYSDGTPGGTIVYQLDQLSEGNHDLRLRVWDTSGNSTSRTIDFIVGRDIAPKLFDIYTDANPASTSTNFYLTHDRPDELITITVEVFNLMGHPIWSTTVTGMSDTLRSFPVNWNLTDRSGRRVGRGIYLYRASMTDSDGITSATQARRLAVTAP